LSSQVEIHLVAYDEASSVIESVGSNLSTTFTDVESKTEELASTTSEATSQMASDYGQVEQASSSLTEAQEKASMGIGQTALSMNNLALSGVTLYMSIDRVENAQVMLDRANLNVERSTEAVHVAQENYNKAVEKYGADSPQAKDAADKLTIAQNALQVANERADMAQRNMNSTMMYAALTVIPSLMSVVSTVTSLAGGFTGAIDAVGGALDFLSANPIVIVVAAIAGIVLALTYAYEHCEWFRNAVNWLGSVLESYVAPVINIIVQALTWLWNNVFVPLGKFVIDYFIGVWEGLTAVWNVLSRGVSAVADALKWLWDSILVPLGKFIVTVFIDTVLVPLKAVWDAISSAVDWLWKNVLEPLGSFLSGALKAAFDVIMVPVNAFLAAINAIIGAAKTVGDVLGGLGKALMSLCFAHATPAAEAFNNTIAESMDLTDKLTGNVASLGDSLKELGGVSAEVPLMGGGGGLGAGAVPTPEARAPVTITITAPLVNVQGSADMATAAYAAKIVAAQLANVVVKTTSPAAGVVTQEITQNPNEMPSTTPTGMAAQSMSAAVVRLGPMI
jgi:hypothetical protein